MKALLIIAFLILGGHQVVQANVIQCERAVLARVQSLLGLTSDQIISIRILTNVEAIQISREFTWKGISNNPEGFIASDTLNYLTVIKTGNREQLVLSIATNSCLSVSFLSVLSK